MSKYAPKPYAPLRMDNNGYERWTSWYKGERDRVRVHRLLAVAKYGFEAVKGKEVHHSNNIPWDNRLENIEIHPFKEHMKIHDEEKYGDAPWRDEEKLRELYHEKKMSLSGVGEVLGCDGNIVLRWMEKYGIETRTITESNEEKYPWRNPELLEEMYYDKGLSRKEIADEFDCHYRTICRSFNRYDIE